MLHLPSQEEGLHVSSGSCRKGTDMTDGWDIFKIYRLIRKKNQYPHLLGLMNLTFMEILEQRGIIEIGRRNIVVVKPEALRHKSWS